MKLLERWDRGSFRNVSAWAAAALIAGSIAAVPSIHETVTADPNDWVCTKETIKEQPGVADVPAVHAAHFSDQCILQLTAELNLDANQITRNAAVKRREDLDAEEHAWMQNYANKHEVEIIYNKYNNEDDIPKEVLSSKLSATNTRSSDEQYFVASRDWQTRLDTFPFVIPGTDMMEELGAKYRNHLFTREKYTLTSLEREQITAEAMEQKLIDDAHVLVERTKSVFKPTDIWLKDGKIWYKASRVGDKLLLDMEQKTATLEVPYEAKYHVTPEGT